MLTQADAGPVRLVSEMKPEFLASLKEMRREKKKEFRINILQKLEQETDEQIFEIQQNSKFSEI